MGMNFEVHLGAYAIVKVREKTGIEKDIICPNGHIVTPGHYCIHCGSELKDIKKEYKYRPGLYELIGDREKEFLDIMAEINEEIYNEEDRIIVIGNITDDGCTIRDLDDCKEVVIDERMPNDYIPVFKEFYSGILSFLKSHEDVESVDVKFGVITYYQ